jgi:hypothetical protein
LYRLLNKAGETIVGYVFLITILSINFIEPSGIYVFFPQLINKILVYTTMCGVFGFIGYIVVGFLVAIAEDLS